MKFEAPTLSEAINLATNELKCSVLDLHYDIIQNSNAGFLGFFKKNAIIDNVYNKNDKNKNHKSAQNLATKEQNNKKQKAKKSDEILDKNSEAKKHHLKENSGGENLQEVKEKTLITPEILDKIRSGLKELFANSPFSLNKIEVSAYDESCVLIELDGEDAALLIGKEGYRYKAISSLLFNWINIKFNLSVRLEIAQFLQNQEEKMSMYLKSIIERVNKNGHAQTKILDGVLVKIALKQLREQFPDKFVGVRNTNNGKCVIVNDFTKK